MIGENQKTALRNVLLSFTDVRDTEYDDFIDLLKPVKLKKGEFFLSQGEICRNVGFLTKGILRVYYCANDKEYTSYFNVDNRNSLVAGFTSFLKQEPSQESIQVLEDCVLFTLSYADLQRLFEKYFSFQKIGRLMAEYNYLLAMERIYDLQHSSANYRYEKFLKLYPGLINKIPHHYIASYIGITPESLSRVRKQES